MPTITLRLTLDVTYDTDNPDVEDFLCDRLRQIPSIAADDGLLSGNCDAFVDTLQISDVRAHTVQLDVISSLNRN